MVFHPSLRTMVQMASNTLTKRVPPQHGKPFVSLRAKMREYVKDWSKHCKEFHQVISSNPLTACFCHNCLHRALSFVAFSSCSLSVFHIIIICSCSETRKSVRRARAVLVGVCHMKNLRKVVRTCVGQSLKTNENRSSLFSFGDENNNDYCCIRRRMKFEQPFAVDLLLRLNHPRATLYRILTQHRGKYGEKESTNEGKFNLVRSIHGHWRNCTQPGGEEWGNLFCRERRLLCGSKL